MSADTAAPRSPTSGICPEAAARAELSESAGGNGWLNFRRAPGLMLVGLIRVYQCTLSPALPILTMGRCGCRFTPTCSHYAADAIRMHGVGRGIYLAVVRLLKCTPLHPGGLDPVPARKTPVCRREPLPSLTSQPSAQ